MPLWRHSRLDLVENEMEKTMTSEELIAFESEIAQLFEQGKIHAPVHLSKGNERELIEIKRRTFRTNLQTETLSNFHFTRP